MGNYDFLDDFSDWEYSHGRSRREVCYRAGKWLPDLTKRRVILETEFDRAWRCWSGMHRRQGKTVNGTD